MPAEFVDAFTGNGSRELLEFLGVTLFFAATVGAWITWYFHSTD